MENIITYDEVEESLAKLYFYLNVCMHDEDYKFCIEEYSKIAKIVEKWIALYATERSLTGIEESDMENIKNIFYDIEFFKYTGYAYYEYIDAFITKIDYYRKHSIGKSV